MESTEDSLIVLGHRRQNFKEIKESNHVHYADTKDISKATGDVPTNPSAFNTKALINTLLPRGFSRY